MKRKIQLVVLLILILNSTLLIDNCHCQWVKMVNGMGTGKNITTFAVSGTNLFAGNSTSEGGVFLSTNNGTSWTFVSSGLNAFVSKLEFSGTNLFAASSGTGVFLSINNGANWYSRNSGLTNKDVRSFAVSGTNLFAGTCLGGIYLSINNGTNWNTVNNGLTNLYISSLVVSGTDVIAGTNGGVFISPTNGSNWYPINNGLTQSYITSLAASGTNLYAGTPFGLFLSTNRGTNWSNIGLANSSVHSIVVSGSNIFAGTWNGVFLSTNSGTNWSSINQGFNIIPTIFSLQISNNYIFAGTDTQSVWRRPLSEIISIQNISTETPSKYSLSQNYPNPFNSTSNLKFQIVNTGDVKLIVYDIMGKEVQTLVNERLQPGTYEAAFDASSLNTGVYFYKLITNGFTETKKMLLIK